MLPPEPPKPKSNDAEEQAPREASGPRVVCRDQSSDASLAKPRPGGGDTPAPASAGIGGFPESTVGLAALVRCELLSVLRATVAALSASENLGSATGRIGRRASPIADMTVFVTAADVIAALGCSRSTAYAHLRRATGRGVEQRGHAVAEMLLARLSRLVPISQGVE